MMKLLMIMPMIFMFTKHPLSMGLTLMIQTILVSLTLGSYNLNYWYSYILTLIMIGGMLILFIYMTSIASNEKFKFNLNLLILVTLTFLISSILMYIYMNNMTTDFFYKTSDFQLIDNYQNHNIQMSKYYNFPSNLIFLMIIIYLLTCLIAIVKISKTNQGPLRQMF